MSEGIVNHAFEKICVGLIYFSVFKILTKVLFDSFSHPLYSGGNPL